MTEHEWLTSTDPAAMLRLVTGETARTWENSPWGCHSKHISDRKLRLFAVACCHMAGLQTEAAEYISKEKEGKFDESLSWARGWVIDSARAQYRPQMAALLRGIIGNPFAPVSRTTRIQCRSCRGTGQMSGGSYNPTCTGCSGLGWREVEQSWLTPTVRSLATAAYEERLSTICEECKGTKKTIYTGWTSAPWPTVVDCTSCHGAGRIEDGTLCPNRLAVLADELFFAGCEDETILQWLRGYERAVCPKCNGTKRKLDAEEVIRLFDRPMEYDESQHVVEAVRIGAIANKVCECVTVWQPRIVPSYRGDWAIDLLLGKE